MTLSRAYESDRSQRYLYNGSIQSDFYYYIIGIVINLVDPASSHMLISKTKPCMSKYKLLYNETANSSLKQLQSMWA